MIYILSYIYITYHIYIYMNVQISTYFSRFKVSLFLPGDLSFNSDVSRYFLGKMLPAQQVVLERL